MMRPFRCLVEKSVFGVCSKLAEQMGVRTARVRLYFIYISFLTIGSPLVVYFFMGFWINVKKYIRNGRNWLMD